MGKFIVLSFALSFYIVVVMPIQYKDDNAKQRVCDSTPTLPLRNGCKNNRGVKDKPYADKNHRIKVFACVVDRDC